MLAEVCRVFHLGTILWLYSFPSWNGLPFIQGFDSTRNPSELWQCCKLTCHGSSYTPSVVLEPSRLCTAGGHNAPWTCHYESLTLCALNQPIRWCLTKPLLSLFMHSTSQRSLCAALRMHAWSSYDAWTFHHNTMCFPLMHSLVSANQKANTESARLGTHLNTGWFNCSAPGGQVQQTLRLLPVGEQQWKVSTELDLWQASVGSSMKHSHQCAQPRDASGQSCLQIWPCIRAKSSFASTHPLAVSCDLQSNTCSTCIALWAPSTRPLQLSCSHCCRIARTQW